MTEIVDGKYEYRFKFQRCDKDGSYWGNSGWFDVVVFSNAYSNALQKAMNITGCNYVRQIECSVRERNLVSMIKCENCGRILAYSGVTQTVEFCEECRGEKKDETQV